MSTTRQLQVSELIKQELSKLIISKFNGLVPGKLLTITQVGISPDLSFAKIYLSIFPSNNGNQIIIEINKKIAPIRFELGKKIKNLRIIPELRFYLDDSIDEIERIEKALKQ